MSNRQAITWPCSRCTFNNDADDLRCQICGHSAVPLEYTEPHCAASALALTPSTTTNAWQRLDGWFCRRCTLLNDAESTRCEACDNPAPVSTAAASPKHISLKYPPTKQLTSKAQTFENAHDVSPCLSHAQPDEDLLLIGFFRQCVAHGSVLQIPSDLVALCVQYYPFEHWQVLGSHSRRYSGLRAVCKLRIDCGRYADDTCYGRVAALSTNTNLIYEWKLSLNSFCTYLSSKHKHFYVGIAAECERNRALCESRNSGTEHAYWRKVRATNELTVRLRFYERGVSPSLSFLADGKMSEITHIAVGGGLKYRLAASLPPRTNIRILSFQIIDAM